MKSPNRIDFQVRIFEDVAFNPLDIRHIKNCSFFKYLYSRCDCLDLFCLLLMLSQYFGSLSLFGGLPLNIDVEHSMYYSPAKFLRTVHEKFFHCSRTLFKNWARTVLKVFKNSSSTF